MSDSINFEQLRKEAKSILKLCRAADRAALERMRGQLPRLAALSNEAMAAQIKLADVHHAVARELGYSNWGDLKRHDDPLARFLAAVRSGAIESAQLEFQRAPDLAGESVHAACALGDADAVRHHLDLDPSLVSAEEAAWQPLLYVCGSPFARLGGRHSFGLRECAQVLLDHGADPNAFSLADPADPESKVSARMRAVMSANHFVFLLLTERGATTDPRQEMKAMYARTRRAAEPSGPGLMHFLNDPGFREELNRRMVPIRERRPPLPVSPSQMAIKTFMELDTKDDHGTLDANLALFRLAIERGADPNAQIGPNKQTALHTFAAMGANMGMGKPLAELFLEHGADPNLAAADGTTPYSVAVRMGNVPLANLLLAHGAKADSASPVDQFVGACRRADSETALSVLRSHPDISKNIGAEGGQILYSAIVQNQVDAVRLMAKVGFDLNAVGNRGASALHYAAWHGHVEMVRFLIEYHSPVNAHDAVYGTSPLAWAAHGSSSSKHWREADDDYCAVVENLISAGASYEAACNKWGVGPDRIASDRVMALLKSRGFYRNKS